jgi:hypothetical protein
MNLEFDIQNRNCLHVVSEMLHENLGHDLPAFNDDPSNALHRHRYGIKLGRIYKECNIDDAQIVIMTMKNLFHHIGFVSNGEIFSFEEDFCDWCSEEYLRERGYIRFIYFNVMESK